MAFRLRQIPRGKNERGFYSYVKGCLTKKAYARRNDAIAAAATLGKTFRMNAQIYRCRYCGNWHVTHCGARFNIDVTDVNGAPVDDGNIRRIYEERARIVKQRGVKSRRERNLERLGMLPGCGLTSAEGVV